MALEVPKAESVSLQVLVDWHRNADIQKEQQKTRVENPDKPLGKSVSKIGMDLGMLGGVDLAWIFGTGRKGLNIFTSNPRPIPNQNLHYVQKSMPEPVAQNQKSMESSHPNPPCACSFWGCVRNF